MTEFGFLQTCDLALAMISNGFVNRLSICIVEASPVAAKNTEVELKH